MKAKVLEAVVSGNPYLLGFYWKIVIISYENKEVLGVKPTKGSLRDVAICNRFFNRSCKQRHPYLIFKSSCNPAE